MDIQRVDDYVDSRFLPEVLKQHGAFVIDEKFPCSFEIISKDAAQVEYHDYSEIMPIIEQFRFYTEHITKFLDKDGNILAEFPPVNTFELGIDRIQPSQFYVDKDKIQAVSSFLTSESDIVVPVMAKDGRYISLDGHTRLFYAYTQGWKTVRAFKTQVNGYVLKFVEEAVKRGVTYVKDMELLEHVDYEIKWNKFCDDFFKEK